MGVLIRVGEKYPLFQQGTSKMMNQDGALFEALEDGGGFVLAVYLNQPHPEEIAIIRTQTVQTRLLEDRNYVLPMIQFGNTELIFEMSFDPTLYSDDRAHQFTEKNNTLMIVTIDSSTGKVVALRNANLPLKFIQHCSLVWSRAFLEADYSANYVSWYRGLQQIPLKRLWENAKPTGALGETYNLQEITYNPNSQHYK